MLAFALRHLGMSPQVPKSAPWCYNTNKTGLQPVSRPLELVNYFEGWVKGPSKQTDRTDDGWMQSTFGAKAENTAPQNTCKNL